MIIHALCGPPGAGKTTYYNENLFLLPLYHIADIYWEVRINKCPYPQGGASRGRRLGDWAGSFCCLFFWLEVYNLCICT